MVNNLDLIAKVNTLMTANSKLVAALHGVHGAITESEVKGDGTIVIPPVTAKKLSDYFRMLSQ